MTHKILEESEEFGAHPGYILQVREQEAKEYMLATSISVSSCEPCLVDSVGQNSTLSLLYNLI